MLQSLTFTAGNGNPFLNMFRPTRYRSATVPMETTGKGFKRWSPLVHKSGIRNLKPPIQCAPGTTVGSQTQTNTIDKNFNGNIGFFGSTIQGGVSQSYSISRSITMNLPDVVIKDSINLPAGSCATSFHLRDGDNALQLSSFQPEVQSLFSVHDNAYGCRNNGKKNSEYQYFFHLMSAERANWVENYVQPGDKVKGKKDWSMANFWAPHHHQFWVLYEWYYSQKIRVLRIPKPPMPGNADKAITINKKSCPEMYVDPSIPSTWNENDTFVNKTEIENKPEPLVPFPAVFFIEPSMNSTRQHIELKWNVDGTVAPALTADDLSYLNITCVHQHIDSTSVISLSPSEVIMALGNDMGMNTLDMYLEDVSSQLKKQDGRDHDVADQDNYLFIISPLDKSWSVSIPYPPPVYCPDGSFYSHDRQECRFTPPGHYNDQPGATSPIPCPAGTSNSLDGESSPNACIPCAKDTYQPNTGFPMCFSCHDHFGPTSFTRGTGEVTCYTCPDTQSPVLPSLECQSQFILLPVTNTYARSRRVIVPSTATNVASVCDVTTTYSRIRINSATGQVDLSYTSDSTTALNPASISTCPSSAAAIATATPISLGTAIDCLGDQFGAVTSQVDLSGTGWSTSVDTHFQAVDASTDVLIDQEPNPAHLVINPSRTLTVVMAGRGNTNINATQLTALIQGQTAFSSGLLKCVSRGPSLAYFKLARNIYVPTDNHPDRMSIQSYQEPLSFNNIQWIWPFCTKYTRYAAIAIQAETGYIDYTDTTYAITSGFMNGCGDGQFRDVFMQYINNTGIPFVIEMWNPASRAGDVPIGVARMFNSQHTSQIFIHPDSVYSFASDTQFEVRAEVFYDPTGIYHFKEWDHNVNSTASQLQTLLASPTPINDTFKIVWTNDLKGYRMSMSDSENNRPGRWVKPVKHIRLVPKVYVDIPSQGLVRTVHQDNTATDNSTFVNTCTVTYPKVAVNPFNNRLYTDDHAYAIGSPDCMSFDNNENMTIPAIGSVKMCIPKSNPYSGFESYLPSSSTSADSLSSSSTVLDFTGTPFHISLSDNEWVSVIDSDLMANPLIQHTQQAIVIDAAGACHQMSPKNPFLQLTRHDGASFNLWTSYNYITSRSDLLWCQLMSQSYKIPADVWWQTPAQKYLDLWNRKGCANIVSTDTARSINMDIDAINMDPNLPPLQVPSGSDPSLRGAVGSDDSGLSSVSFIVIISTLIAVFLGALIVFGVYVRIKRIAQNRVQQSHVPSTAQANSITTNVDGSTDKHDQEGEWLENPVVSVSSEKHIEIVIPQ